MQKNAISKLKNRVFWPAATGPWNLIGESFHPFRMNVRTWNKQPNTREQVWVEKFGVFHLAVICLRLPCIFVTLKILLVPIFNFDANGVWNRVPAIKTNNIDVRMMLISWNANVLPWGVKRHFHGCEIAKSRPVKTRDWRMVYCNQNCSFRVRSCCASFPHSVCIHTNDVAHTDKFRSCHHCTRFQPKISNIGRNKRQKHAPSSRVVRSSPLICANDPHAWVIIWHI